MQPAQWIVGSESCIVDGPAGAFATLAQVGCIAAPPCRRGRRQRCGVSASVIVYLTYSSSRWRKVVPSGAVAT
jgi:hypothetical protein